MGDHPIHPEIDERFITGLVEASIGTPELSEGDTSCDKSRVS